MIVTYIPTEACAAQVRPMSDERKLQQLASVDPKELRPEFTEGLQSFMGRLLQHALPKTLGTTTLTGAMLAGALRATPLPPRQQSTAA
eukprot:4973617-Pyramimonas_sp.AAC.1